MPDREKVISHFQDAIEASGAGNGWRFVRVDMIEDAIALLKEQDRHINELHRGIKQLRDAMKEGLKNG